MTVTIKKSFISRQSCADINTLLRTQVTPTPRPGSSVALGWESFKEASTVGFETNSWLDSESLVVTTTLKNVILEMRDYFKVDDLVLVNAMYTLMEPDGYLELHCDACNVDGSPLDPSVEVEPNEWSAVLYLNDWNIDYTGGEVVFPNQELVFTPDAGDLIYFEADVDHPHGVNKVIDGERLCIVIFTGRLSNVDKVTQNFSDR